VCVCVRLRPLLLNGAHISRTCPVNGAGGSEPWYVTRVSIAKQLAGSIMRAIATPPPVQETIATAQRPTRPHYGAKKTAPRRGNLHAHTKQCRVRAWVTYRLRRLLLLLLLPARAWAWVQAREREGTPRATPHPPAPPPSWLATASFLQPVQEPPCKRHPASS
jgi:hypothetical protein